MKSLYIFSVLLLVISPIYTFTLRNSLDTINESVNKNSFQQNLKIRSVDEKNNLSISECKSALKEFEECIIEPKDNDFIDLNLFCMGFHTEKCINYINGGLPKVRGCSNDFKDDKQINKYYVYSEFMKLVYKLHCTKDENGNYCPVSLMDSENRKYKKENRVKTIEEVEKQFYTFINNTCVLKECRETIINIDEDYKYLDELEKKLDKIKNSTHSKRAFHVENLEKVSSDDLIKQAADYLKSEECLHLIEIQKNEKGVKNREESKEESNDEDNACTTKYHIYPLLLSLFLFIFNIFN